MMNSFLNLRTGVKLFISFGLMALITGAVIVTAYFGVLELERSQKALFERDFKMAVNLLNIRALENRQRVRILELLAFIEKEDAPVLLQDIKSNAKEIDDSLEQCLEIGKDDARMAGRMEELRSTIVDYRKTRDQQIVLINSG